MPLHETGPKALVNCRGCAKCCREGGPVYVLKREVRRLEEMGVPLFPYKDFHFIRRLPGGQCVMLDKETGQCSIYEQRPLSCKLFPLDIFAEGPHEVEWVLFNFCPTGHRKFAHPKPGQPSEFELAIAITSRLERELPEEILREIKNATIAVGEIDIFEPNRSAVRRLKPVIPFI